MPIIFLSPSLQPQNQYVIGGTEQYYMNLIADAMEPYLRTNGIQYTRNKIGTSVGQSIRDSNKGYYDLHLAIHSNAAPPSLSGKIRGTNVYYYANSSRSKRAAEIIAKNFKKIYPNPELVTTKATTKLAELTKTNAPAVLIETAYHDNVEDAEWIRSNITPIASNLVMSLTEYFGIPFISPPQPVRIGKVTTQSGNLNIRSKPSTQAKVIGQAPKGAAIKVLGETQGWYVVNYNGIVGYSSSDFITI
ncbi:MAG TPA: N-acetylmuramoyl-L-alanine amidase [Oscillospiraceae bacterium]|nr:N-acetylmuramoyl-L-alanine amidase [Oscillospiraceae bacterium]